jgi:hypothetical protein
VSERIDVLSVIDDACHALNCTQTFMERNALLTARAAVAELIEVVKAMLPRNLCLTNPNVPDDTKLPLTATMGELRSIAAALARMGVPNEQ